MSDPSSSPRPDWEAIAALVGENDPYPTEEETREHKAKLAEIYQTSADAIRRDKAEQVRALLKEHNRRKAAAEAGEPYVEPGEPI